MFSGGEEGTVPNTVCGSVCPEVKGQRLRRAALARGHAAKPAELPHKTKTPPNSAGRSCLWLSSSRRLLHAVFLTHQSTNSLREMSLSLLASSISMPAFTSAADRSGA